MTDKIKNLGKFAQKGNIPWNKGLDNRPSCIECGQKCSRNSTARCKNCCRDCYRQKGKCIDCGVQLKSFYTTKCKSCAHVGKRGLSGKNSPHWKGGRGRCSDCGKKLTHYKSNSITGKCQMCYLQSQFQSKEPTNIESKVYSELKAKGIFFESQKLINGRFIVDAYIPSLNLVIEADGNYWHSLDRIIKKDRSENMYLEKCGYNLLRLSEKEILDDSFKGRMVFPN